MDNKIPTVDIQVGSAHIQITEGDEVLTLEDCLEYLIRPALRGMGYRDSNIDSYFV